MVVVFCKKSETYVEMNFFCIINMNDNMLTSIYSVFMERIVELFPAAAVMDL